jgi:mannonate dehydratase
MRSDQAGFMVQAMRWFGPADPVSLSDIRQAGATDVVTALHEISNGEIWPAAAIRERQEMVAQAGLRWSVVESLPVHEAIKTQAAGWEVLVDNYAHSLANLADCGLRTVTYNFMPVLDWTRTDLAYPLPDGARALRFDLADVAVFDVHLLERAGAERDYPVGVLAAAAARFARMNAAERKLLERTIIAGLPGSEESFGLAEFQQALDAYAGIDAGRLREHLVNFLQRVCPTADALGVNLVVHPDDPPFPLFGLPRVVSTQTDLDAIFERVPNRSNGLCLCTGSLGARSDNDLPAMVRRFGARIHFLHLRNVAIEEPGVFHEATHLYGAVDMPGVLRAVREISLDHGKRIPMRPDHGHQMLDDLQKVTNPGYSAIGRLRGLAELRGLELGIAALSRQL